MAPGRVSSPRERDRISALAAGLAATIIGWTFAAAFTPGELESFSQYSPWLYGPIAVAAWALFSAIAYLLISRDQRRRVIIETHDGYRCRDFPSTVSARCSSVCADLAEKTRLAAISAGFALTITSWVITLAFMPDNWLDWLGKAPAWLYCVVSITLWAALSEGMYLVFNASRTQSP